MKYTIQRRKTVPIPGMEYSSMGWFVGIEGDEGQSYEDLSKLVEELEIKEAELNIPEYITANEKFARLKLFMSNMSKDPTIGPIIKSEWKKFISKPEPMEIDNQTK